MPNAKFISIDDKKYALDSLSEVAKSQLTNLRIVDREIARLQTQLGIAQTARAVFVNGIKNNLPADAEPTSAVQ